MTLIKSISGFRGTIGGKTGDTLNPVDIAKSVSAFAALRENVVSRAFRRKIVVGRDARISGEMVSHVVCGTLMGMGFDVVNIGLASTPTTELAVTMEHACGGIIITASHNPRQWNALKFLNEKGEFLPPAEASEVVRLATLSWLRISNWLTSKLSAVHTSRWPSIQSTRLVVSSYPNCWASLV